MAKMTAQEAWKVYMTATKVADDALALAKAPTPMLVGSPTTPLGSDLDVSGAKPVYYVAGGLCGVGSIKMPANTAFAREMMAAGVFHKSQVAAGCRMYVGAGGQSFELKSVWASAFAASLRGQGIAKVFADVRVD